MGRLQGGKNNSSFDRVEGGGGGAKYDDSEKAWVSSSLIPLRFISRHAAVENIRIFLHT
jgi:hypothetical protein